MDQQTTQPPKTKEQLREEMLSRRSKLGAGEIDAKSAVIAMQIFNTEEFKNSKTIFTYASFSSEVSTNYFIKKALLLGKKICIPKIDKKKNEMYAVAIRNLDSLKPNAIGIPEAGFLSFKVNPEKIGLIIVPASVFDLRGHRIGSGKGYYDKYLAQNRRAKAIGLAYDFQIVDRIMHEPHDIKVNKIITEKRFIDC